MMIPRKNIIDPIHRGLSAFNRRTLSSASASATSVGEWITIEKLDTGGDGSDSSSSSSSSVAKLIMRRPPANSLNMEFMQDLSGAIKTLEDEDEVQSIVLTSALTNGIFSAGLELSELYQPSFEERLPSFWSSFQQLYLDLYGSRLSTVAAVDGHAPAAGCMLALCCDYRVMTSKTKCVIGLNESMLGIVAPPWLCQMYIDTIGLRQAELALLEGTLWSPQDALKIGLVDELVDENKQEDQLASAVVEVAIQKAIEFAKIPSKARVGAKAVTRGRQIKNLIDNRQHDSDYFCSYVEDPAVQKTLGQYLEQLAKRKK
mmetsp:Transcript_25089/g.59602  ORF Transcript_25089/g.59602 Transcript_25089/m.59602 type:complete len:316 (+) Transcript_25089:141-1088(+)